MCYESIEWWERGRDTVSEREGERSSYRIQYVGQYPISTIALRNTVLIYKCVLTVFESRCPSNSFSEREKKQPHPIKLFQFFSCLLYRYIFIWIQYAQYSPFRLKCIFKSFVLLCAYFFLLSLCSVFQLAFFLP